MRENGALVKCFDEFFDGVTLSDELRKLLVMEDSEHYYVSGQEPVARLIECVNLLWVYALSQTTERCLLKRAVQGICTLACTHARMKMYMHQNNVFCLTG